MRFPIQKILDDLAIASKNGVEFAFFEGNPVWTRKQQYKVFRKFFYKKNKRELKCVICGTEADHFKMLECKGDGSLLDGERKHTFKLYDKNHNLFTIDHWIPKWLMKKLGISLNNNLVPMCTKCNALKGHMLPEYYRGQKTPKRWRKAYYAKA